MNATERYAAKAIRRVVLNVNRITMPDVLEQLESKENMQRYIIDLIRADIRREQEENDGE